MKFLPLILLMAWVSLAWGEEADKKASLWLEGGPVWQTVNTVQIPSDTGTRFSLVDFGTGPSTAYRVYLGYKVGENSELRALYAPLALTFNGVLGSPVSFQGSSFSAGPVTEAYYRFNSYRLTYRYRFYQSGTWKMRVGFTGKIRDAEVRLTQGAITASRANVGFVPLLHFSADWKLSTQMTLIFDVDALAAPQGRAEDIALQLGYALTPGIEVRGGYRTVEGGAAGGGGVYSFAWLHYGSLGVFFRL